MDWFDLSAGNLTNAPWMKTHWDGWVGWRVKMSHCNQVEVDDVIYDVIINYNG